MNMLDWVLVVIIFTGSTDGHVTVAQVEMRTEKACFEAAKKVEQSSRARPIAFCLRR